MSDDEKGAQVGKVWPTLEEVLTKEEWREDDITVLVAHQDELDAKTLARLGVKLPGADQTMVAQGSSEEKSAGSKNK